MMMLLAAWLLTIQAGTAQGTAVATTPAVVLKVTMPSGSVNRLTIRSGKHGWVGAANGPGLDVVPSLKDDRSLELVVSPLAWDPATGSFTSGGPERQILQLGDTTAFGRATFPIAVEWLGTVSTTAPLDSTSDDEGAERCCVACDSEILFGRHVETPCGACCAGSCDGEGGDAPPMKANESVTGSRLG